MTGNKRPFIIENTNETLEIMLVKTDNWNAVSFKKLVKKFITKYDFIHLHC